MSSNQLTKEDFRQMFTRSCTLDSAWNYERQQNLAFGYMMVPAIRRLYDNPEDRAEALKRHLEFMAVTPHLCSVLVGVSAAMEEENANNEEFETSTINAVKTGLMGPLAGIGDSFFWGTLKLIATGISLSFAKNGSIIGPILFFMIINIPGFLSRYYGLKYGYKYGVDLFSNVSNMHIVEKVTTGAAVVGLLTIGAMVSSMINFELVFNVGQGEYAEPIMSHLDAIMPKLLPAIIFGLMYYLLGKKIKTTTLLFGVIVFSCVLAYFGIV